MLEEKLSLEGKSVVITGGGTGLGREMTLAMARAGADLVIASRRIAPIQEVADIVCELGRKGVAISTDVTDSAQVASLMESAIAELGKVDVLFNNAGIVRGQGATPIWEISDDDWHLGIDTNMSSAFYCSRAIARHMVERGGGKIVNLSSGFGYRGGRDNYMYCVGKGGIVQLTRTLAASLGRYGITSTCIVPGFIPDRGHRRVQAHAAQGRVYPDRQGGASPRDRSGRRIPGVLRLRLHERRGIHNRRRWTRRRLRPHRPRPRNPIDDISHQ